MERFSRFLFVASLLLCGAALAHLGCGTSDPGTGSGARAVANGTGGDAAAPDIKKGVKVTFRMAGDSNSQSAPLTVLEVRGNWISLDYEGKAYWYNMDNFLWYQVH